MANMSSNVSSHALVPGYRVGVVGQDSEHLNACTCLKSGLRRGGPDGYTDDGVGYVWMEATEGLTGCILS